jgi:hypothetical protein
MRSAVIVAIVGVTIAAETRKAAALATAASIPVLALHAEVRSLRASHAGGSQYRTQGRGVAARVCRDRG